MIGRFKKLCVLVVMSVLLLFSHAVPAMAATLTPDLYAFSIILASCGAYPGRYSAQWFDAYEGYLEANGKTALLSKLHSLSSLSWGSTVTDVDELVRDVKSWLLLSPDYVNGNSFHFELASGEAKLSTLGTGFRYVMQSTPYSGCAALPDSGYKYIFTTVNRTTYNGVPAYCYRNYYVQQSKVPSGAEILLFVRQQGEEHVNYNYFSVGVTGSSTVTQVTSSCKFMMTYTSVSDGSILLQETSSRVVGSYISMDNRGFMNAPYKAFYLQNNANDYCAGKGASRVFDSDTCHLTGGHNSNLKEFHDATIYKCSDSLVLPADVSTATSLLSPFNSDMTLESLQSGLSAAGLEVSYSQTPINISAQPVGGYVDSGDSLRLNVVAAGADSYQWQYSSNSGSSWSDLPGEVAASCDIVVSESNKGYRYRCKLSNDTGVVVYSDVVSVLVKVPISIKEQPYDLYRDSGESAEFLVLAEGFDSFEWEVSPDGLGEWAFLGDGYVVHGYCAYKITVDSSNSSRFYRCRLSNETGTVMYSDVVTVLPRVPIVVISQPVNTWAEVGSIASFEFLVEGDASYEWRYSPNGVSMWQVPSGLGKYRLSSKLVFENLTEEQRGYFWRCTASTESNYIYSDVVFFDESLKPVLPEEPISPADSIVSSFKDLVDSLRVAIMGVLPKALVVCGIVLVIMYGIRFFKKITSKG